MTLRQPAFIANEDGTVDLLYEDEKGCVWRCYNVTITGVKYDYRSAPFTEEVEDSHPVVWEFLTEQAAVKADSRR